MSETTDLLGSAIQRDFFGDGALSEPAELHVPERYRLARCLGRGGFGVVYLATDTVLQRPVALKFLTEAGPADIERFRREARYAARLDDPAVVKVYELGDVDGHPYIAMQYIDGKNLDEMQLEPTALVRVLRSVAVALQHAHTAGIVHRDIKPQNILVDREGRAFVTDFGIARCLNTDCGATLSVEGLIIGTPALMSPEQARGERNAIDARSDVYALGATLFCALTGRMPFEGATLVDVLHAVIHDAPPFPRSIAPTVPRSLEAITLKCLQKDSRDRYPTMAELVAEFNLYLAGLPVKSESAAWFRRLVGAPPPRPALPSGADPHLPVVLEAAREISAWDASLYRVSANICKACPQLDAAIDRLSRVLEARPDYALARFYRGLALFRRGRIARAIEDMECAIDRVTDVPGAHFELGRLYLAAYLRQREDAHRHITRQGVEHQLDSARERLAQAVLAFQEAQRLNEAQRLWHVDYTRAVERLAQGDADGCVAVCDEVLARDADIEEVWKLRGDALCMAHKDPFESYDRALAIRRCFYEALYAKAEAHLARGDRAKALEALARALEINPEFTDAMVLLARCDLSEGGRSEAAPRLQRALELDPAHYEATVTQAELLNETGRATADRDCFTAAIECLSRAKKLEGCQNRVNLVIARAMLERARLGGPGAHADLEAILKFRDDPATQREDAAPWVEMFKAAMRLLDRGDRGCPV